MKKYNDIGELYREMFSDYAPQPPVSVWEGVKSAAQNKQSVWKKITFPIAGAALVGAVVYLFMANPEPKDSVIVMTNNNQENTEKQVVNNEKSTIENLSDELNERNVPDMQYVNLPAPICDIVLSDSSDDNLAEETSKQISDKKTSSVVATDTPDEQNQKQNQVQNTVKITQNEVQPPKILPLKISKDTTVCENSVVQLYAYNVENVRWSTGEAKNLITIYPSYSEQYSVTISRASAKDTTVYIHINVVKCLDVHIPNAFTPNGDGLNDIFLAKTDMKLKSFEMTIYSANGRQVLFTSKDINRGWDGTYNGQMQPHGMYYYTVRYTTDNLEKIIEKRGELLLILQ